MATEAMVQPDEISQILKQQLLGFEKEVDVYETGTVLMWRRYCPRPRFKNVRATELVEFNDIMGMALNLEEDNVGCVLFGDDTLINEGDQVKRTGRIVESPWAPNCLDASSTRWGNPLMVKETSTQLKRCPLNEKHRALLRASRLKSPCRRG